MKIGESIRAKKGSVSFEFFPPKDKAGEDKLLENIKKLGKLNPVFVSVTCGAGGGSSRNTVPIVDRIKKETSLTVMPHLTCIEQTSDELKGILEGYKKLKVFNLLALRGDPPQGSGEFKATEGGFNQAVELVELTKSLGGFSIGVAVYPEKHCESATVELDLYYTKMKTDAGGDFGITQMFFDNRYFYEFMDRAAKLRIDIPILAGIMPINNIGKIKGFAEKCGATMPDAIVKRFEKSGKTPEDAKKVGVEVATEQCADLIKNGFKYFQFYTLNQADEVTRIVNNLGAF